MSKWYCHCCRYKNDPETVVCKVCGRDESYAQTGYPLPLHGATSKLYRPSQINHIITEEGLFERDSVQWTALHSAAVNGNFPVVEELLKRGSLIDAVTEHGQTALHLAAYSGSFETVQMLIQNGADVNAATFFEKLTPLHIACQRDWKSIAKFLIDNGANVNLGNVIDRTPLHFVAQTGRTDLGVMLLKAGAQSERMDSQGWTARQVAEFFEHREIQELLVQVNMKDKQVVIKKLPPAPWHCDLWDATIRINKEIKTRAEKEMEVTSRLLAQAETLQHNLLHKPERESRANYLFPREDASVESALVLSSSSVSGSVIVSDRNSLKSGANSSSSVTRKSSIGSDVSSLTGSNKGTMKMTPKARLLAAAATRVLASK